MDDGLASKVVLHLGSMKSGTSFIQNVLGQNKDRLAESDVLFPGPRWRAQVRAVRELMGHGGARQPAMPDDGPWRSLVDEINAWTGIAVVSMEFLAPRPRAKIEQIVADFPDTQVEAVLTCRDLGRNIPAMWQEAVQNGGITDWTDYLDAVRHRRSGDAVARGFWRQQDIPAIADRWADVLGDGALTLVTVPPRDAAPDLLWRRFADAAGFDVPDCDLEVRPNQSIGLASAQFLLRLNQRYHREFGAMPPHYDRYVKQMLAKRGLVHRSGEQKLGLDERWVVKLGEAQIEKLRDAGHRVIGDLHDLKPVPVPGVTAGDITAEQMLDAAVDGVAIALEGWAKSDREARRLRNRQGSAS